MFGSIRATVAVGGRTAVRGTHDSVCERNVCSGERMQLGRDSS